jgi:hypothetical protein
VNENRFRLIPGSLSLTSYEIAAFKAFNLDPAAPGDLRILVRYLAFVLFGRRRAGPRRKWTYDQLFNLYKEYEAFKARCPEMKDVEICGLLAGTGKYPSGRSGRSDAGTIRRKLQDARRYCVTVEKVLDQRIREALKSSS